MKVSIIIPNYNGETLLRENLPKILSTCKFFAIDPNHLAEIVVVDDCSADSSLEVLKKFEESFSNPYCFMKVFKNDRNKGFSSTVNKGVKNATGEIVILLNTDVYPENEKHFISHIIPDFQNPKVFAVGFMDKSIEKDKKIVLRGRGVGKWKRGFLTHWKGDVDRSDTLWVSGGSGAFRRSIWEKMGGLNELYDPFYWEDIDLSYRGIKSGYTILFDKTITVVHEHEEGAIKKNKSVFTVKETAYRNQILFVWLNVTETRLFFSHLMWLPFHIANTLMRKDTAFVSGLFQAVVRFPRVLQSRSQITRSFSLSDEEVIAAVSRNS